MYMAPTSSHLLDAPGLTELKWCSSTAMKATPVTMATPISCSRSPSQIPATLDDSCAR